MTSYVYKITNKLTNKSYVGKHTWKGEGFDVKYWGSGLLLWKVLKKYGFDNFERVVLEFVADLRDLHKREVFWIQKLNTVVPNGYNLTVEPLGGFYRIDDETNEIVFNGHYNEWEKLSEEERKQKLQKMWSLARTPEARKKISEKNRERYMRWSSEKWKQFKQNCSDGWSKEQRLAQKDKVKGNKNGMYGKSYFDRWVELYGREDAEKRMNLLREKLSKKSKENNNRPEVRAKFQKTVSLKRQCKSYAEWQHARALAQGLKVRFKRGKVSEEQFNATFPELKKKEEFLAKCIKMEVKEIESQNRGIV